MPTFFITGTDTEVGKTVATGLIAYECKQAGRKVVTQKWIQSGLESCSEDIETHLELMKANRNDYNDYLKCMTPYKFQLAASAHLAAKEEGRHINPHYLFACSTALSKVFDFVFIEGLGGLQVPINDSITTCDLLEKCNYQTIVVVDNKLGAINHALLTLESLRERKIPVAGIIINQRNTGEDPKILDDNIDTIQKFGNTKVLAHIRKDSDFKLEKKDELMALFN